MNTMDRCFEVEDLVVPEDYEQTEMMSSPDSWPQWGITDFWGPCLPKKISDSNMTHEELTFNGGKSFYTSTDMAADSNNKRLKSNNSSMSQELYNNGGSLLWNNQADFQQFTEEETRINHITDIFFDSLLEDDLTYDSSMPHDTTILDNNTNIFEGQRKVLHTRNTSKQTEDVESHDQSIGYLKYLNTNAFSPSTDWGNGEALTTCRDTSNQNSTQESVLKDLERVSTLFSEKTRICLRDAFYRLAESSKDTVNCQDGELMTIANEDTLRYRETEPSDSKTTTIDRVVGSLMLSNLDFEDQQVVYYCQHRKTDYNDDAVVPSCGIDDRFASLYPTFVI